MNVASNTATTTEYEFRCPGCAERIVVNAPMRDTIVSEGCVICGTPVSTNDVRRVG